MPLKIKVGGGEEAPKEQEEQSTIKIEVVKKDDVEGMLNLRSSINGDLMIMDHKDIDIVIQQKDKKVVTFAKETLSDLVYGAESRLLEYLRKSGLIEIDSIKGGNIYGSLEGKLQEGGKVVEITLLKISEWMQTERPSMDARTSYDDMEDEHLISPDGEYSTEFGEVPHEERKGSINQRSLFAPYLYGRYTYE